MTAPDIRAWQNQSHGACSIILACSLECGYVQFLGHFMGKLEAISSRCNNVATVHNFINKCNKMILIGCSGPGGI